MSEQCSSHTLRSQGSKHRSTLLVVTFPLAVILAMGEATFSAFVFVFLAGFGATGAVPTIKLTRDVTRRALTGAAATANITTK